MWQITASLPPAPKRARPLPLVPRGEAPPSPTLPRVTPPAPRPTIEQHLAGQVPPPKPLSVEERLAKMETLLLKLATDTADHAVLLAKTNGICKNYYAFSRHQKVIEAFPEFFRNPKALENAQEIVRTEAGRAAQQQTMFRARQEQRESLAAAEAAKTPLERLEEQRAQQREREARRQAQA